MTTQKRLSFFDIEKRDDSNDGKMIVSGYALKFDRTTELYNDHYEVIRNSALDNTDVSRVFLLLNHDPNMILASTNNGTLRLEKDETGLRVTAELIETNTSRDTYQLIKSGALDKMSFSFVMDDDSFKYHRQEDGTFLREITGITKLYDVAVVTYPAYDDTEMHARGYWNVTDECNEIESRTAKAVERMKKLEWN